MPAARTCRCFSIGLGSDQPARDLRLGDLLVDEAAFVGDLVNFDFKLTAEGLHRRSDRSAHKS